MYNRKQRMINRMALGEWLQLLIVLLLLAGMVYAFCYAIDGWMIAAGEVQ